MSVKTIESYKSDAWKSGKAARRYHDATVATPTTFSIAREDVYVKYVQSIVPEGGKILDLGCGSGIISRRLHDLGYKVVGCDISEGMIETSRSLQDGRTIEFRVGSGLAIPAENSEFDAVISRMFIAHFANWREILIEKARVTKPAGSVIFDFGSKEHWLLFGDDLRKDETFPYSDDQSHTGRFYDVATLGEMEEAAKSAGLELEGCYPFALFVANGSLWEKLGKDGCDALNAQLSEYLKDEAVRDFYQFFEKEVLSLLPRETSYNNMTILRKTGDREYIKPVIPEVPESSGLQKLAKKIFGKGQS